MDDLDRFKTPEDLVGCVFTQKEELSYFIGKIDEDYGTADLAKNSKVVVLNVVNITHIKFQLYSHEMGFLWNGVGELRSFFVHFKWVA